MKKTMRTLTALALCLLTAMSAFALAETSEMNARFISRDNAFSIELPSTYAEMPAADEKNRSEIVLSLFDFRDSSMNTFIFAVRTEGVPEKADVESLRLSALIKGGTHIETFAANEVKITVCYLDTKETAQPLWIAYFLSKDEKFLYTVGITGIPADADAMHAIFDTLSYN